MAYEGNRYSLNECMIHVKWCRLERVRHLQRACHKQSQDIRRYSLKMYVETHESPKRLVFQTNQVWSTFFICCARIQQTGNWNSAVELCLLSSNRGDKNMFIKLVCLVDDPHTILHLDMLFIKFSFDMIPTVRLHNFWIVICLYFLRSFSQAKY